MSLVGIYQIRNLKNGKKYIGQSINIKHRWNCHVYDLNHNRHSSPHLQYAWNNNPNDFVFEIICQCKEEDLNKIERNLIVKYKTTDDKYGYNVGLGGDGAGKMSEETKKKLSKAKIGNKSMCGIKLSDIWKKHLSEAQPHKKKVKCIETGVVYDSFADAARRSGCLRCKIVACCTGTRKTTGGLHWEYYDKKRSS